MKVEGWSPPKFESCAMIFGDEFVVMLVNPYTNTKKQAYSLGKITVIINIDSLDSQKPLPRFHHLKFGYHVCDLLVGSSKFIYI